VVLPPFFAAGVCAAFVSWAFAVGLWSLALLVCNRPPANMVVVVACCASVLVCAGILRGSLADRVRQAAYSHLAWVVFLYRASMLSLSDPLVAPHLPAATGLAAPMAFESLTLLLLPFLTVLTAAVTERARRPAAVQAGAAMVTALALALLGWSLRSLHRPAPDAYVASLPVVVTLQRPDERFVAPSFTVEHRREQYLGVLQASGDRGCQIYVGSRPMGGEERPVAPTCEGVRILHDEVSAIWVVDPPGGIPVAIATREGGPHRSEVTARSVPASVRAPTSWMVLLGSGCLGAVVAIAAGVAVRRRARAEHASEASGVADLQATAAFAVAILLATLTLTPMLAAAAAGLLRS
jgi:hypothetical protein